ncbi:MAG: peptidoglycan editing factor PgeF, partial [Burkholderiales bacterium]|nr:peptidoglycan editing factor PgeF [Anaerolineae bacterium]
DALVYYQFTSLELKHGVFTRCGGTSSGPFAALNLGGNVGDDPTAVRRNHELMYSALGVRADRVCTVWQVHSADAIIANGPVRGRRWLTLADAIITDRADTPLAMRFADCTPLLFHDPVKGVIGMAHAGWRGTVAGVGTNTVKTMIQAYGCHPADIRAGIGPSIGPNRYQVGEEVVAAVQNRFQNTNGLIRRDPADNSAYLDLWAANRLDLERAGIEQIEIAGICTAEHTDEFFSHRAEKGLTGRFGATMSL